MVKCIINKLKIVLIRQTRRFSSFTPKFQVEMYRTNK